MKTVNALQEGDIIHIQATITCVVTGVDFVLEPTKNPGMKRILQVNVNYVEDSNRTPIAGVMAYSPGTTVLTQDDWQADEG